ncbi:transcription antiterminator BglG [Vallitalea longa]|uniref:Transcription antiterminator BglG n=1 Tax=Vallitalea longa TaxID=2936439 RepID=A0A9W5Y9W6_9FIRM|nr:PRD domain-containing protein [Vallitalea longa]GKX28493.1 transcription antiterminator BglG [Vallitalea longa]
MSQENAYHIIKALNNNVILARNTNNQEMILIGKGIGFGKKTDKIAYINDSRIQKVYSNSQGVLKEEYIQLVNAIDRKVIGVVEEIILLAEKELGHLDEHIHIALVDHVGFALERLKQGMVFSNPFLYEIKTMYKDEYDIALKGKSLLFKRLGVTIPDDEVGYIALHLYSSRQRKDIKHTIKDTRLLNTVLQLIEKEIGYNIDKNLTMYKRLIIHLKQSITRSENNKEIVNPLLDDIIAKLDKAYHIAEKVAKIIEAEKGIVVSKDEKGFLALHIERLRN